MMDIVYNQPENPWQLGTTGGRIARWVFGFGFFTVHLGVFLVSGFFLLILNLIRTPDNLWSGGPLFRWGFLVAIHFLGAVVCWAITTAMDAARETRAERDSRTPLPFVPPASLAVPPVPITENTEAAPAGSPRMRFQPPISTPATGLTSEDNRQFEFRNWRGETPYAEVRPRSSPPGWTVMGSGSAPVPPVNQAGGTAPLVPPRDSVPAQPPSVAPVEGDERWTWVEAAAEAWLANRAATPPPTAPRTASAETGETDSAADRDES